MTVMFADEPAAKAVEMVDPLAITVFVESKRTT